MQPYSSFKGWVSGAQQLWTMVWNNMVCWKIQRPKNGDRGKSSLQLATPPPSFRVSRGSRHSGAVGGSCGRKALYQREEGRVGKTNEFKDALKEQNQKSRNDNKTKKSRTANVAQVIIRRAHPGELTPVQYASCIKTKSWSQFMRFLRDKCEQQITWAEAKLGTLNWQTTGKFAKQKLLYYYLVYF